MILERVDCFLEGFLSLEMELAEEVEETEGDLVISGLAWTGLLVGLEREVLRDEAWDLAALLDSERL